MTNPHTAGRAESPRATVAETTLNLQRAHYAGIRPKAGDLYREIIAVHEQHPAWGGGDIADYLECTPGYVYAVARRVPLNLPKQKREGGKLRRTERGAALMDLGFLRRAIEEDDPLESILRRIDDLTVRLRKEEG